MGMTEEDLIKKWLADELSAEELEKFNALDDSAAYKRIVETAHRFKVPSEENPPNYQQIKGHISKRKPKKAFWAVNVASVVVLALAVYMIWFYPSNTVIETNYAETDKFLLPDESEVVLNADSRITYDKENWATERLLTLEGEALFSVTTGNTFSVETPSGTVTVVGTKFNVANRRGLFEVTCYEGKVKVDFKDFSKILNPGERVLFVHSEIRLENVEETLPDWQEGFSKFEQIPFGMVCEELERQFNKELQLDNVDSERIFSGAFSNNDINKALTAITEPMNLGFTIRSNRVVIHAKSN